MLLLTIMIPIFLLELRGRQEPPPQPPTPCSLAAARVARARVLREQLHTSWCLHSQATRVGGEIALVCLVQGEFTDDWCSSVSSD